MIYTTVYPSNWKKVSAIIRKLANGHCQWCGRQAAGYALTVHHLGIPYADGRPGDSHDKHDLRLENLAAICFECHDAVDHIRLIRKKKKERLARRRVRVAQHRMLGIGTGLVAC